MANFLLGKGKMPTRMRYPNDHERDEQDKGWSFKPESIEKMLPRSEAVPELLTGI